MTHDLADSELARVAACFVSVESQEHRLALAEMFRRYGESYEDALACELCRPNVELLTRQGWPLGVTERWLKHDHRGCSNRGSGCGFCERTFGLNARSGS